MFGVELQGARDSENLEELADSGQQGAKISLTPPTPRITAFHRYRLPGSLLKILASINLKRMNGFLIIKHRSSSVNVFFIPDGVI